MQYDMIYCKGAALYHCSILSHLESQIAQNNKEWIITGNWHVTASITMIMHLAHMRSE